MLLAIGAVLASGVWAAGPAALGRGDARVRRFGRSRPARTRRPRSTRSATGSRSRAPPRRIVSLAAQRRRDPDRSRRARADRRAHGVRGQTPPTRSPSALAPKSAARVTGRARVAAGARRRTSSSRAPTRDPRRSRSSRGPDVPVVGTGSLATFDDVLGAVTTLGEAVGEPERAHGARGHDAGRHRRGRLAAARAAPARPPVGRGIHLRKGNAGGRDRAARGGRERRVRACGEPRR